MSSYNKRLRLKRLYARDPCCHWCGVVTFLPPKPAPSAPKKWRMATVDHLDSRLSPERGAYTGRGIERTVLACWKCNNDRCAEEVASLPREELHRRSGRYPRSEGEAP